MGEEAVKTVIPNFCLSFTFVGKFPCLITPLHESLRVRELIYKRGYGKLNQQRTAVTDNAIVERALRKYDIICTEDLIHEIMTVGPHFKQANNFL
uniref:Uncharacterized protein n=1 Tax=Quercus lobata TaxID=97700 RepID=A0A7N2R5R5_QUELO